MPAGVTVMERWKMSGAPLWKNKYFITYGRRERKKSFVNKGSLTSSGLCGLRMQRDSKEHNVNIVLQCPKMFL